MHLLHVHVLWKTCDYSMCDSAYKAQGRNLSLKIGGGGGGGGGGVCGLILPDKSAWSKMPRPY
jgi:hypothetical protein